MLILISLMCVYFLPVYIEKCNSLQYDSFSFNTIWFIIGYFFFSYFTPQAVRNTVTTIP